VGKSSRLPVYKIVKYILQESIRLYAAFFPSSNIRKDIIFVKENFLPQRKELPCQSAGRRLWRTEP